MIAKVKRARLRRVGWAVLSVLLAGYILLFLSVRIHESIARSRSESLYADFLKLEPGRTTKSEVELLRKQWAPTLIQGVRCGDIDCEYTIGNVWGQSQWFLLSQVAHDHQPTFELLLNTEGDLLSSAAFYAAVLVPKGYGTREERKWLSDSNYIPYSSGQYMLIGRASLVAHLPDTTFKSNPDYRISGPSGCTNCLAIWVSALPTMVPATRAQIFQINFDCMTRWVVCTDKEDIMPTAGREYAKEIATIGPTE
jgi:hypothetical protein